MARSTVSAATERAYGVFAPASRGAGAGNNTGDEFDESDIWGSFEPAADVVEPQPLRARSRLQAPTARTAGRKAPPKPAAGAGAAHGSLPVNIPDWSKILGNEYRGHQFHADDWEADDVLDDEDTDATTAAAAVLPPHELAGRRRAASLSVHDGVGIGRTLKVRDAVWKKTGFQA
ncbi:hypothetical protein GUJ93_ZPchr0006g43580 [Zizania palustris]|uniref:Senescence regulator n=1 Tax=Zizania palustris TaxID=103762 RepID=A0A8J5SB11_ZIZPA|nr:hypothetical protein GUJ93_ZPchr0006g43580 [Zizania palustris]